MNIIGISAYYHDSAAALIKNGEIVAAAQEERFTRKKHDPKFPKNALEYCLSAANLKLSDIDNIVFYDKPLLKFDRLLETYFAYAPLGLKSFLMSMPIWIKEKLFLKTILKKELQNIGQLDDEDLPSLLFTEHHQAHASSAFFPSPFEKAAVICMDGVGEWATTSVWLGEGNNLTPIWHIDFPHSLGLLYSAFTYFTGFKVNSGEYKLMGLAPYGNPIFKDRILDSLLDLKDDGTFRLDMKYFNFATGLTMTSRRFAELFDGPRRAPETPITQREMDIAASIQSVTEEIVLKIVNSVSTELNVENICLAGGVALNCVSNGRLLREASLKNLWIQPAAGDAGGAVGAALSAWHEYHGESRTVNGSDDKMFGCYLGPEPIDKEAETFFDSVNAIYKKLDDEDLYDTVAQLLAKENVIGWMQGRMEFGPRALGGRSILGDPRSQKMQSVMNLKIKYRESFRPFAPSILREHLSSWFELDYDSPYMLLVAPINEQRRIAMTEEQDKLFGIDKLNIPRSEIPAVTHVDYSARIQTVTSSTNPRYHALLQAFYERTGCPVLVNTSFNVRGEPIVCSPEDAYRCFMRTEMDYLVVGPYLLNKNNQPEVEKDDDWQDEFELD